MRCAARPDRVARDPVGVPSTVRAPKPAGGHRIGKHRPVDRAGGVVRAQRTRQNRMTTTATATGTATNRMIMAAPASLGRTATRGTSMKFAPRKGGGRAGRPWPPSSSSPPGATGPVRGSAKWTAPESRTGWKPLNYQRPTAPPGPGRRRRATGRRRSPESADPGWPDQHRPAVPAVEQSAGERAQQQSTAENSTAKAPAGHRHGSAARSGIEQQPAGQAGQTARRQLTCGAQLQ